jgi:hypothetical protein
MSATSFQARRLFANLALMAGVTLSLSACDYIGSFSKPKQTPEEAKAEGIALGAGCRQAGQSLEDCYQRNPEALKAGIFSGWKDMHEYMAAKGIQTVTPAMPAADASKDDKDAKGKDAKDSKDTAGDRSRSRDRDRDTNRDSTRSRDRDSSRDTTGDRRVAREDKPAPKY